MTNNTDDLKIIEKYYRKDKTDTDIHRFYDRYLADEGFRLKSEAFISMKSILPLVAPNVMQPRVKRTLSFNSVRILIFDILLLVFLGVTYFSLQNPKDPNQYNPDTNKPIESPTTLPITPSTNHIAVEKPKTNDQTLTSATITLPKPSSKPNSSSPKNQVLPINPTDKEKRLILTKILKNILILDPMGNSASSNDKPNNKIERRRSILNKRELDSLENKCRQMAKNDPLSVHFTEFEALGDEAFRIKEFKWAFDRFKTFYDNEKNNLTPYQSAYITYKMLLCIVDDWEHLKGKSQEVLKTFYDNEKDNLTSDQSAYIPYKMLLYIVGDWEHLKGKSQEVLKTLHELDNVDKLCKNNFDKLQVDLQQTGSLGKEISKALNNAKVYN